MKTRSDMGVALVDFVGGDRKVAMSAKVSYGKDSDERLDDEAHVAGLINFLLREGHMSPFESSVFTFRLEVPIFVSREIVRHRSSAFSEISARYTRWNFEFYVPDDTRPVVQQGKAGDYRFDNGSKEQYARIVNHFDRAYTVSLDMYEAMLAAGIAKEVARDVLPVGLYTHMYMTVNARNLMHFINLRGDEQALWEIREVARQMEQYLEEKMPYTYRAWKDNK